MLARAEVDNFEVLMKSELVIGQNFRSVFPCLEARLWLILSITSKAKLPPSHLSYISKQRLWLYIYVFHYLNLEPIFSHPSPFGINYRILKLRTMAKDLIESPYKKK